MNEDYDFIYLSPHLDDAVLSCGAQIFQHISAGRSVMIVTIMAGDPPTGPLSSFAQSLHQRWQLPTRSAEPRREEDIAACAVIGANNLHWNFPDCIYRRHSQSGYPLYSSDDELFGEIDPSDHYLVGRIRKQISNLPNCGRLMIPLTVGSHVDHRLVRKAAELAANQQGIIYYEEFPYNVAANNDQWPHLLDGAWDSLIVELSNEAIKAKIEAIECYKSQINTFFSSSQDIGHQIQETAMRFGGEKLWLHHPI